MPSVTIDMSTADAARVTAATQAKYGLAAKPGVIQLVKDLVKAHEKLAIMDVARSQSAEDVEAAWVQSEQVTEVELT